MSFQQLNLYCSSGELTLEAIRTNNNLYILIQDKAKTIKSYSSKANAANKKKTFKQKWIKLLFLSEKEVDKNSNNKDKPPA